MLDSLDHYGLKRSPKDRVNFLFRDHTYEQLNSRPIVGYIYDIIKWIELAEEQAHDAGFAGGIEAAAKICRDTHNDCQEKKCNCCHLVDSDRIRILLPKKEGADESMVAE